MENKKRLIDADALIKHLGEEPMVWCDGEAEIQERDDWRRFKAYIEVQDTIDAVEVVHGKVTEYEADEWYGPIYQCHECGCEMMVREPVGRWEDVPIRPKLCANCGAMFDGERKDNG